MSSDPEAHGDGDVFKCQFDYLASGELHMATNLSIDPELIERALKVSGERTKKAAVTKALQEFIARRRQKRLLDLMGKLEWDSSYDYKAERRRD
jgi:Arc/MetJ family transcription regulator